MRKTKIFHGNQYIASFECDGKRYTKFQLFQKRAKFIGKRTFQFTAVTGTTAGLMYATFIAGAAFNPKTTYATIENTITVTQESTSTPIMLRIAKCESGGKHTFNGQVVLNANTNKSVDIGLYQINVSIWGKKATALGLNLAVEADNIAFANYLYKNFGTEPWYSSKACWNK